MKKMTVFANILTGCNNNNNNENPFLIFISPILIKLRKNYTQYINGKTRIHWMAVLDANIELIYKI